MLLHSLVGVAVLAPFNASSPSLFLLLLLLLPEGLVQLPRPQSLLKCQVEPLEEVRKGEAEQKSHIAVEMRDSAETYPY